jgi:glucose/arabinose dehydrogenase
MSLAIVGLAAAGLSAAALGTFLPIAVSAQGGDVTPPTLTSRSPAPGATGVSTLINGKATFSEPIQAATLSMVLRNSSNQVVASQVTYDNATRTATLDPSSELAGTQTFTVTVSGARDLAGNVMTQVSWGFTTATAGFQDVVLPQTGLVDPTVIQFASDGRLFVAEKSGRIWAFDNLDDPTPTLVANLQISVHNFWDRGMLGMVLDPNFPATPYIYVLYAYDAVPGGTAPRWGSASAPALGDPCPTPPGPTGNGCVVTGRLSRLDIGNPANWPLDPTDEQPLITDWPQQFPSHSTGSLVFGPDGALYVTAGDGASFNYVDNGQTASSPTINDPAGEGGALRSQDILTSGDPVTLDGAVIRVDPVSGLALPDNPRYVGDPDPNGKRIVAHGLRNPFRATIRPGTREVWVGDVGWGDWEEINRVLDPIDATVDNFGWPCYEGYFVQDGYDGLGGPICEGLYGQGTGAVVMPYYAYHHVDKVVTGEACPTGSSSISGLAFYSETGGSYPSSYNGALFFSDYSRNCIWAMRVAGNGLPDPANRVTIRSGGGGPVNLIAGPGGDIFYPGYDDDRLHRIRYVSGNLPPTAVAQATPNNGPSPLDVTFSATGSSDPEGLPLAYAWDLDADGAFDDSTSATPQWTYEGIGNVSARVRVTDAAGLSDVAAVNIAVSNSAPTAIIDAPAGSFTWKVGDLISFSGRGADPDEPSGFLPASALTWDVIMHHCPSNCHTHNIQTFSGVSSGALAAPDHEYPSHLELRLTVTDVGGLQSSASRILQPQTVALTFQTNPTGLQLSVNAAASATPFTRTVIVGSANSVSAPSPQTQGGLHQFSAWSDGGAQTHIVTAPATATAYTATFTLQTSQPGLVAAYAMDETSGTSIVDWAGNSLTGAISGATRTASGKFGGALSFDGVNDLVTIADANLLDFTTGMTLEAWVFPTANGSGTWRNVLIKERPGGEVYNLYSNADTNAATFYIVRSSQPDAPLDVRGLSQLPVNTWTHLAVTFDNAALRLYVNGLLASTRAAAGPLLTSAGALRIGGNSIWGEYFAGRIDEVRLYNRVLSGAEIQTDMNTGIGVDSAPPVRSGAQPSGSLPAGTTEATLGLTTSELATCRYSTVPGVAYSAMTGAFTTTGGTTHSTTVTGLADNQSYSYYVRCQDAADNANPDDFAINFSVEAPDTTSPVRSNGQPTGTLPAGTTQATLALTTSENATCRFGTAAGVPYASLPNVFTSTGGTSHASLVTGLANGGSYTYYVRCQDAASNANPDDFAIAFSVATPPAPDTTLPTVSMTAPAPGTVSGSVTVTATASDNIGVVGVQFLLNGANLGTEDTVMPYSIAWNTTSVSNGTYQLAARARDAAGNSATAAPVTVTVNNTALPGLVAAYNFNEGAGSMLTDRSGLSHTGTISGAAWTTQGKYGSALTFDGIDDWVTVADRNDLDFTTGMTIEAWVFPTALGSGTWRNVVIKERSGGETYNLYANSDTDSPKLYVVRSAAPGVPLDAAGTSQLPLNVWTHLAATYNGSTVRLYVNGTQVGTRAVAGPLLTSTGVLRLGGNSVWGEYFAGRIDEVRLYNRALSAAEIQSDLNAPVQ